MMKKTTRFYALVLVLAALWQLGFVEQSAGDCAVALDPPTPKGGHIIDFPAILPLSLKVNFLGLPEMYPPLGATIRTQKI
jgi:hypothetical protein